MKKIFFYFIIFLNFLYCENLYRFSFKIPQLDWYFSFPYDIEIDSLTKNIYVLDVLDTGLNKYNKIKVFNHEGKLISSFGIYGEQEGQLYEPHGFSFDNSGKIYIADTRNNRIQVFDKSGNFIFSWGSYGNQNGKFYHPWDVAVDSSNRVYVLDTMNHRVQVFNQSGEFLFKWGSWGSSDGQFNNPCSIFLDRWGNVYIADTNNNRIQIFSSSGTFIRSFGSLGSNSGQFNQPYDVFVDTLGYIYVADTYNHRVQIFNNFGIFVSSFGRQGIKNGEFNYPYSIFVDKEESKIYIADKNRIQIFTSSGGFVKSWCSFSDEYGRFNAPKGIHIDTNGKIYVADTNNHRIQIFSSSGNFLNSFGNKGSGESEFNNPYRVVVDSISKIYVLDTSNNRIQIFSSNGELLKIFGSMGSNVSEFYYPYGLCVDKFGKIYVADTYNSRIQVFDNEGDYITSWGDFGSSEGNFKTPYAVFVDSKGFVYVADTGNFRIQVFNYDYEYVFSFNTTGNYYQPYDLFVDDKGYIYVLCNNYLLLPSLQIFDSQGNIIYNFGLKGSEDGEFNLPYGIYVDTSSSIYIADTLNHRIQKFVLSKPYINGYVKDVDGSAISNVKISLIGPVSKTTYTDINGYYEFLDLIKERTYTVIPTKEGFIFSPSSFTVYVSSSKVVNFVGIKTYSISGNIKDQFNNPLNNVKVSLICANGVSKIVYTNDSGYYEFLDLVSNTLYTLSASKKGFTFAPSSYTIILNSDKNLDFMGYNVYEIKGYIKDELDRILNNVKITLTKGASSQITFSDFNGYYEFLDLLGYTTYTVIPTKENWFFSPSSYTVFLNSDKNLNFVGYYLLNYSTFSIKGYVRDENYKPIENVKITIFGEHIIYGYTNNLGYYELKDLIGGTTYLVKVDKKNWSFYPPNYNVYLSTDKILDFTGIYDFLYPADNIELPLGKNNNNVKVKMPEFSKIKLVVEEIPNKQKNLLGTISQQASEEVTIIFRPEKETQDYIGKEYKILVFNLSGDLVYEFSKIPQTADDIYFKWLPQNLSSGVYIVYVYGPGVKNYQKIIILK